ncbi:MAG: hypothetical protein HDS29_00940 [Bacteroides sp.]|nr:hypothetical protein [Bacteroides sp.]
MAKGRKTGGRAKGTPNKENPLKGYIRAHSLSYFEPKPQTNPDGSPRKIDFTDKDGAILQTIILSNPDGSPRIMSDFEIDIISMEPNERINAELRLLKFHLPEMKAIDMDMTLNETSQTIEERLAALAEEENED